MLLKDGLEFSIHHIKKLQLLRGAVSAISRLQEKTIAWINNPLRKKEDEFNQHTVHTTYVYNMYLTICACTCITQSVMCVIVRHDINNIVKVHQYKCRWQKELHSTCYDYRSKRKQLIISTIKKLWYLYTVIM